MDTNLRVKTINAQALALTIAVKEAATDDPSVALMILLRAAQMVSCKGSWSQLPNEIRLAIDEMWMTAFESIHEDSLIKES